MRKIILPALLAFLMASCSQQKKDEGTAGSARSDSNKVSTVVATGDSTQVAAVYQCPMDCETGKTYDKPGKCPVCGMDLEKKS
jgi:hypothetical protein